MKSRLNKALLNPLWIGHKPSYSYTMDGKPDKWKIAYYPLFDNGKNGEVYEEPRALVERPIEGGIDFREVPLRYLNRG